MNNYKNNYNPVGQGYESHCDRYYGRNNCNNNYNTHYRDSYQRPIYVPIAVPVSGCVANLTGYINCATITRY